MSKRQGEIYAIRDLQKKGADETGMAFVTLVGVMVLVGFLCVALAQIPHNPCREGFHGVRKPNGIHACIQNGAEHP